MNILNTEINTKNEEFILLSNSNIPLFDENATYDSINSSIRHLKFAISCSLPDLLDTEWNMILNTYAGVTELNLANGLNIGSDILDELGFSESLNLSDLPDWIAPLIDKLLKMSEVENLAIMYFNQIFWNSMKIEGNKLRTIEDVKKYIKQSFFNY